jgi:hypothetical protein
MVGDLGKAVMLKEQELWDIEAWTHLSNYPVPEGSVSRLSLSGAL